MQIMFLRPEFGLHSQLALVTGPDIMEILPENISEANPHP
jgi:hypothetical protein